MTSPAARARRRAVLAHPGSARGVRAGDRTRPTSRRRSATWSAAQGLEYFANAAARLPLRRSPRRDLDALGADRARRRGRCAPGASARHPGRHSRGAERGHRVAPALVVKPRRERHRRRGGAAPVRGGLAGEAARARHHAARRTAGSCPSRLRSGRPTSPSSRGCSTSFSATSSGESGRRAAWPTRAPSTSCSPRRAPCEARARLVARSRRRQEPGRCGIRTPLRPREEPAMTEPLVTYAVDGRSAS